MKKTFTLFLLFIAAIGFSQSVNDYKYVVLPNKFDFQKADNQYNLSTLTKMMLEKYGFTVYFEDDQKPDELALDRCKGMYANVEKVSGFLSTNVIITIKDCKGVVLFTSQTGKSKEKDYKVAYNEAFRKAARSFEGINYSYKGSTATSAQTVTTAETSPVAAVNPIAGQLFAQPIPNGYQLVDTTPKVVLRIYKTTKADSYTAISDKNNGLVFKKGDDWYFEYYENDQLRSEKLNIKF